MNNQGYPVIQSADVKYKYGICIAFMKLIKFIVELLNMLGGQLHQAESHINGSHKNLKSFIVIFQVVDVFVKKEKVSQHTSFQGVLFSHEVNSI